MKATLNIDLKSLTLLSCNNFCISSQGQFIPRYKKLYFHGKQGENNGVLALSATGMGLKTQKMYFFCVK